MQKLFVKFHESFFHNELGLFSKGEVYEVLEDVELPKHDITVYSSEAEMRDGENDEDNEINILKRKGPYTPRNAQKPKKTSKAA